MRRGFPPWDVIVFRSRCGPHSLRIILLLSVIIYTVTYWYIHLYPSDNPRRTNITLHCFSVGWHKFVWICLKDSGWSIDWPPPTVFTKPCSPSQAQGLLKVHSQGATMTGTDWHKWRVSTWCNSDNDFNQKWAAWVSIRDCSHKTWFCLLHRVNGPPHTERKDRENVMVFTTGLCDYIQSMLHYWMF